MFINYLLHRIASSQQIKFSLLTVYLTLSLFNLMLKALFTIYKRKVYQFFKNINNICLSLNQVQESTLKKPILSSTRKNPLYKRRLVIGESNHPFLPEVSEK